MNYISYHFQKCTKLPKYLRYFHQASVYIYELSIAVLKISKLPSPTNRCMLMYLKRVTSSAETTKLPIDDDIYFKYRF